MNIRYEIKIWKVNHEDEVIIAGSTKVRRDSISERDLKEFNNKIEKWMKMIDKMMEEFQ